MELRIGGNISNGLLGSNQIGESGRATTPSRNKHTIITSHATARIETVRVRSGVGSEYLQRIVASQGKHLIFVLQQSDGISGNRSGSSVVVGLHVDELVDNAARREEGSWIQQSFFLFSVAGEVGEWIVFVLSKLVPCRDDPSDLLLSVSEIMRADAKGLPYHSDGQLEDLH